DAAGLLPLGLLLQSLGHVAALLVPLGGLVILGASLDNRPRPWAGGLGVVLLLMGLGLILAALILNLVAACHFALAPESTRARPLGLALLVLVVLQGLVVTFSAQRFLDPDRVGQWSSRWYYLAFSGLWTLMGLELVRLSLIGW